MSDLLIIEDDEPFIDLIVHALRPKEVRFAHTMKEALLMIDCEPPDAILLDLSLPDSTTIETLARIDELKTRAKGATVIIITGHHDVYSLNFDAKVVDGVLSKNTQGFFQKLSAALLNPPATKAAGLFEKTVGRIERTVRSLVDPKD